ncbi:response regulator [Maribacter sp. MJ134]|uniref:ATP-binding protein n=1 Tax=Maribacter sp. MJ134 TaxID=2496865 RepID=UPI000F84A794|nr:ATP-binding protein [Maribacter sp. MJ134]AZQ60104.1 response regulator [Maribacter sp. MJ134]
MSGFSTKLTQKIIISYLLLVILAVIASSYVYSEISDYLATESTTENDVKLLKTNTFVSQLYEAESLSELALQTRKKSDFNTYKQHIETLYKDIDELRGLSTQEQQLMLLDSLQLLLEQKVLNTNVLRKLKTQDQTSAAIDMALEQFEQMEANLGVITAEGLAPNLEELSPKAQEAIEKVAHYLNSNIPTDESNEDKARRADSVLNVSRSLLREVKEENMLNLQALTKQERTINRTNLELSQQLGYILASFEKEILVNSINDTIKKETALKRSIRLASGAALLGFLVVVVFIFILNRDFWKANLYRKKLEKEKKFTDVLLKSRERLIRTVSHDVRTPLNTISGYTTLLEDSKISQQQQNYISNIKSATGYMTNLVNDLLDFSQLDAEKMKPEKIDFNLADLLTETAQHIATAHANEDISLTLKIENTLERPIVNDPVRIRQIIANLIGNAFKFTLVGEILVKANIIDTLEPNLVQISISDTGVGISKEQQEVIFNEFEQAPDHRGKNYHGYGLGLSIAKKLTQLLGGSLTLESEVGKGSVFTLKFPLVFGQEEQKNVTKAPPIALQKPLRILIIDDDTAFLHLLGEMLRSENITPILYSDFNLVPMADADLAYDLVLTDIEMPKVSGFDIVKQLPEGKYDHYKNQPILAMTGRKDLKKEVFTSKGFLTVLRKPFSKSELLQELGILNLVDKMVHHGVSASLKGNGLYHTGLLESFLGDDGMAIQQLLETFRKDTIENQKSLKIAFLNKSATTLSSAAHRMLPMFRQLQITEAIPILEVLEEIPLDYDNWKNIKIDFDKLHRFLDKLLETLENDMTKSPVYNG